MTGVGVGRESVADGGPEEETDGLAGPTEARGVTAQAPRNITAIPTIPTIVLSR
jgi:hypothetical protein